MMHVRYHLPFLAPLVSIIIPNKAKPELIEACITSIRKRINYPRYELVIVDNGSTDLDTLRFYDYIRPQGVTIEYITQFLTILL
ncbi:hypothetical protein ASF26_18695 [Methylobacterium sp. Leaf93]|nr:hypothetical protein ASF26_18695 [Methylobacterium sp. Leaf93]